VNDVVVHSHLVFPDGDLAVKHQGNPSGFPNTLRLNCVVHMMVYNYILLQSLRKGEELPTINEVLAFHHDHMFLEICGDDSRIWVLSQYGMDVFGASRHWDNLIERWKFFPWEGKLEGEYVFPTEFRYLTQAQLLNIPPFISRKIVHMDGYYWQILASPVRSATRLLHSVGIDPVGKVELQRSYANANAHLFWWHETGACKILFLEGLKHWDLEAY